MNWKTEAVDRLSRYTAMKTALKNIPDEIKRLAIEACRINAAHPDKLPVISSIDTSGEALLDNMIYREELQHALDCAQIWVETTERAMDVLKADEQKILLQMYVNPERGAVGKLCETLGVEQSTIYRKRDQALHRFTVALYGFTDTQFERGKK